MPLQFILLLIRELLKKKSCSCGLFLETSISHLHECFDMHVIYHTYLLSTIFTVAMSIIRSVLWVLLLVLSAYHIHSDYLTFLPGICILYLSGTYHSVAWFCFWLFCLSKEFILHTCVYLISCPPFSP